MENGKLTTLDWRVYESIKSHTLHDEKGYASQEDIINDVNSQCGEGENFLRRTYNPNSHDICPSLWVSIAKINDSPEVEKIVVIDRFRYYLATEEDADKYIASLIDGAKRKLKRAYTIKRKLLMDGQGKLISCQGKEIGTDSKAREFVEATVDGIMEEIGGHEPKEME